MRRLCRSRTFHAAFRPVNMVALRSYTPHVTDSIFFRQRRMKKNYDVVEINEEGAINSTEVSQYSVISELGVHSRDFLNLEIDGAHSRQIDNPKSAHPMILPRANAIVVSMGSIKALLARKKVVLFEPEKPLVMVGQILPPSQPCIKRLLMPLFIYSFISRLFSRYPFFISHYE